MLCCVVGLFFACLSVLYFAVVCEGAIRLSEQEFFLTFKISQQVVVEMLDVLIYMPCRKQFFSNVEDVVSYIACSFEMLGV